jgi:Domain of unknown function (DUF4350)
VRGRGALGWLALAGVAVLVALIVAAPTPRNDRPLDPRSSGPTGARAVVLLLEELGAEVSVADHALEQSDTALLLEDDLDSAERAELRDWVRAGGLVVVADPSSPLTGSGDVEPCPQALAPVEAIGLAPGAAGTIERGDDCYDDLVRASSLGDGDIVVVQSPRPFTNQLLGEVDNAVLAATLLAPDGSGSVTFLRSGGGTGERRLWDLLGPRAAQAIVQVGIAVLVYVLWRGRRLGRVVADRQPVQVAGSELVSSVGRILASRRRPGEAAATIRAEVRRELERQLGLPAGGPIEPVAAALAARTGLDAGWVVAALHTRPVTTDDELTAVVADLDRIRGLVLQPVGGTRT